MSGRGSNEPGVRSSWPMRADLFGILCAFVVVYCLVEQIWEPLAALALVLGAFAVALPRMIGYWRVGGAPPVVEGEFERRVPTRQAQAQAQAPARAKGSDVD